MKLLANKCNPNLSLIHILNGAVYYSEQKQPAKALDLAAAYIDMPQLPAFSSELLPKDSRYASVVYYAAVSAYNLQKNEQALKYFREYLNTGTEAQEKDCYVYMNMIYQSQKKYACLLYTSSIGY